MGMNLRNPFCTNSNMPLWIGILWEASGLGAGEQRLEETMYVALS